ncbi:MAG TPA: CBS domain-containing protein, partial [Solirubrobacterales bacterium]|nr:CBS domain-containing protein [Solirubrobacterales bacterium]
MSEVSVTVGPSHTLRQAAKAMVGHNVGAALVIDDEAPSPGIVTERDLLLSVGAGEDPDVETVGRHMTESVLAAAREAGGFDSATVEGIVEAQVDNPRPGNGNPMAT